MVIVDPTAVMGPKLGVADDVAFAIGTTLLADERIIFGVVTIGGTMTGVEALSETRASGVVEGCGI